MANSMMAGDSELLELGTNPDFFVSRLSFRDGYGIVRRVSEETYRNSSFMDDMRMVGVEPEERRHALDDLIAATEPSRPALWMFHTGHTGSTAISRALAASTALLAVREPQILNLLSFQTKARIRTGIANERLNAWQDFVLGHLTRSYRAGQRAAIKPTSIANNLMAGILEHHPDNKVVFICSSFERYAAQMCKYSAELLRFHKQSMHLDAELLFSAHAARFPITSHGELVALSWCLHGHFAWLAFQAAAERLQIVDFDDIVRRPRDALASMAAQAGIEEFPIEQAEALLGMNAKDSTRRYSADDRHRELTSLQLLHSDEIAKGRRWLEIFCRELPFPIVRQFAL